MNPLRAIRCWFLKREIDRACAVRKAARLEGKTVVSSYTREKVK